LFVTEGAIVGNREFDQHVANLQFVPENEKTIGKTWAGMLHQCISSKNRKFLQPEPSS
jgi:hypothetical protein